MIADCSILNIIHQAVSSIFTFKNKWCRVESTCDIEFLQKELGIRKLKFSVVLIESDENLHKVDIPLSSKEQYQKIIEQFPLVKELKERLKLDLDY